jgi:multidrug transporter EmrE-like cation transporter
MWAYAFLGLAIVSEVIATSALKASDGMSRLGPAAIVVVGYGIAFYLLAQSLKSLPVGFVYAIWAGLGIIGVALIGAALFGETFTTVKVAGIAMIVAGVALVQLGAA